MREATNKQRNDVNAISNHDSLTKEGNELGEIDGLRNTIPAVLER